MWCDYVNFEVEDEKECKFEKVKKNEENQGCERKEMLKKLHSEMNNER